MPRVGFEHTISAGERPKTYALDREATGTGLVADYQQIRNQQTHTHEHTNQYTIKTIPEISSFALIHPTYRLTQSMCTGLRKQFYAQQQMNVNSLEH